MNKMNKTALMVFMFVVILACVLAYFGKVQQIKSEREWKDSVMSMQITTVADNAADHDRMNERLGVLERKPAGISADEVVGMINAAESRIMMNVQESPVVQERYVPTAYCVTQQDGEKIRLDCRKLP